jgi:protease-4
MTPYDEKPSLGGTDRPGPPPQTIIIERPPRKGWFRRVITVLVILFLIGVLGPVLMSREAGLLPSRLTERYVAGELTTTAKIAIVTIDGLILGDTVEHAIHQIHQAREDKQVKAVVLRVDSPGGTVSGSDRIWREVEILKQKKPVVASMGGLAASGGYYVAAPADAIFAEPTTMTGSIGVIAEFPQASELMSKIGVGFETIATGEWKDSGSPFRPMTEREKSRWHEVLDYAYQRFVRVVAQGRQLPLKEVLALANGKVYTAQEALDLKLVNAIGYQDDAIAEAKARAHIDSAKVVQYAKSFNLREALLGITAPKPAITIDAESLLRLQTPRMYFLAR